MIIGLEIGARNPSAGTSWSLGASSSFFWEPFSWFPGPMAPLLRWLTVTKNLTAQLPGHAPTTPIRSYR